MKYVLRVFVVLVLAAGIVYGVFRYTNPEAFVNNNAEVLTTVSKPAATEKNYVSSSSMTFGSSIIPKLAISGYISRNQLLMTG